MALLGSVMSCPESQHTLDKSASLHNDVDKVQEESQSEIAAAQTVHVKHCIVLCSCQAHSSMSASLHSEMARWK